MCSDTSVTDGLIGSWMSLFFSTGEIYPPLGIDLQYLDLDHVSHLHDVFYFLNTMPCQFRNMNESLFARQDLDEGAKVHYSFHLADVYLADFGFLYDRLNDILRFVDIVGIDAGDSDLAVVVDINGDIEVGDYLTDGLASRSDDFTDLLLGYREHDVLRCIF